MSPSHTRGCAEVSEPLYRNSALVAFQLVQHLGERKVFSLMYIRTYPNAAILLRNHLYSLAKPAASSRTAEHFSTSYIRGTSKLNPV